MIKNESFHRFALQDIYIVVIRRTNQNATINWQ